MDKIAVLIPCYNESRTVAKVVSDFRRALPEATVYVYDNNSTERFSLVLQTPNKHRFLFEEPARRDFDQYAVYQGSGVFWIVSDPVSGDAARVSEFSEKNDFQ